MYGYGYSLYNRTPFLSGGGAAPVNSVAPVISGTQTVGQTLTSTTGTWTGIPAPTFTYQWYRGASLISGATSSTYVLVQADAGNTTAIKCVVTATNSAGVVSADSNTLTGILDANAAAYLTATGITGTTQRNAINTLNIGLKSDGLWSKMKAVYPFVTDNRNLLSYTDDFGNGYWSKNNATVTTNTTTAPDGTTTADTITPNTTNGFHNARALNLTTIVNSYTYSIYAKANGYNFIGIQLASDASFPNYFEGVFNLSSGTIETTGRAVGFSGTRSITAIGNGWYRCSISITNATSSNTALVSANPQSTNDPTITYAGNGTSGIFVWGAQLELGSTATTYQPIATTQQAFISNQFKYNLVNPVDSDAAFRLVFNGGWTHSANGATPNGTNGFADTKLVPSSVLSLNSTHISCYTRTNTSVLAPLLSSEDAITYNNGLFIWPKYSGNLYSVRINDNSSDSATAVANTQGLHLATRTASNVKKYRHNTTQIFANTTASTSLNTSSIYVGASRNNANYSTHQTAFATIGDGLTDTEAANLYTRVQAFQTALSRQV